MEQMVPSYAGFAASGPVCELRNITMSHPRTSETLEELFMRNMTHIWVSFSEVEVKEFT